MGIVYERRKEETPMFARAMKAAYLARNWLAMEVLSRAFNETDPAVWRLNLHAYLGVTEYWIAKIAKEKGLSDDQVHDLKKDFLWYEAPRKKGGLTPPNVKDLWVEKIKATPVNERHELIMNRPVVAWFSIAKVGIQRLTKIPSSSEYDLWMIQGRGNDENRDIDMTPVPMTLDECIYQPLMELGWLLCEFPDEEAYCEAALLYLSGKGESMPIISEEKLMAEKLVTPDERKGGEWKLEGFDAFDSMSYPLLGSYVDEAAAKDAAKKRLSKLATSQPGASTGSFGIQDQIFVVRPDGTKYRYFE